MKKLSIVFLGIVVSMGACGSKQKATEDATDKTGDGEPMRKEDGTPAVTDAKPLLVPSSCKGGQVVYGVGNKLYRTTLGEQASHEDLSTALDGLKTGEDKWISSSPDGQWFVMESTRFGSECDSWTCMAVVKSDFSSGEALKIGGKVVRIEEHSAIASGGKRVVYPLKGGPHGLDLYVTNLSGADWSSAKLLTADSTFPFNRQPSISRDGTRVVFDCGNDPYGQPPTSICEVRTDGSAFRVVWTPEKGGEGASGRSDVALHHPGYLSDGSIVFEADWNGEQVWHLTGNGPPVVIASKYSNDNSPCVLANDCIVSLWLEREGGGGSHELKVMDYKGGNFAMIRTNVDVVDTGTSCSN